MSLGLNRVLYPVTEALATVRRFVSGLPLETISKIEAVIRELTDPSMPVWRRALLVAALVELVGPVKVSLPVRFVLRYLVIRFSLEVGTKASAVPDVSRLSS